MRVMGGDEVAEAVASAVRVLEGQPPEAGDSRETARAARRLAAELLALTTLLVDRDARPPRPSDAGAAPARMVETAGGLLAAAVRAAPAGTRYVLTGGACDDASGLAAEGVAEALLTAHTVARSHGAAFEPPDGLAEGVLTRLHPRAAPGHPPWPTLLWARGLGALPGRDPVPDTTPRHPLRIPAERVALYEATVAAAYDLSLGGDGGFEWLGGGPYGGTREAAGMVARAYEAGVLLPGWGLYVVVREADRLAVGGIGFHGAPDADGEAEIGYDLVARARGNGLATDAVRALSDWALAQDGVGRLLATVARDNAPSHAVLERAGYQSLGEAGPDGTGMTAYEFKG
ncbi:GNAT family N-acetyltransferase [Streptomyces sp. NPDC050560]|uniref:GNAT family N-acetyltransferase n=1 Tax=Streptomyces sp. NPDC050560 TaxID=3365630 RepID=UPI0037A3A770